ncbi:MAG: hypothetical protein HY678_05510 [Chloroflexi bacterium]|nr:hypothetical protein [Chloroflexota bacterium]
MSGRPGRTILSVDVGLTGKRTRETVTEPAFVALKRRIMHALTAQTWEAK